MINYLPRIIAYEYSIQKHTLLDVGNFHFLATDLIPFDVLKKS